MKPDKVFSAGYSRWPTLVAVGVLVAMVAGSCGGEDAPFPPIPAAGAITMAEYSFQVPPTMPEGRAVFEVQNSGTVDHQLTLIRLPDSYPPLDEQLRGSVRRAAATVAVVLRHPGTNGKFAVDLTPGRWGVACFLADADGVQHARKGMNREFRVG